ncbi:MAG: sulfurtransferase TusA family protein [Firmicutes bacterium]|nr:sulfurtransferase TusA family protein [Bacillota bacterium]
MAKKSPVKEFTGTVAAKPERTLDLRGECCPYPPIFTLQELESMADGQVLEVLVDHPPSVTNVPLEVSRRGHKVLGSPVKEGPVFRMYFQAQKKKTR